MSLMKEQPQTVAVTPDSLVILSLNMKTFRQSTLKLAQSTLRNQLNAQSIMSPLLL